MQTRMVSLLLVWTATMYTSSAQTLIPLFGEQKLINGYHHTISGESLPYFSIYPKYAKEALLTRASDGRKAIEWVTDIIPTHIKGDYAYFVSICVRAGLPKPRPVPDTEQNKDTKRWITRQPRLTQIHCYGLPWSTFNSLRNY